MAIPNDARSTRYLDKYTAYHLAALRADPAAAHLVAPTEQLLAALRSAAAAHAAAEQAELELAALFQRKDFDLDELTRIVELGVLAATGKDRGSSGYRAALPQGLSGLIALRGRDQENATREFVAVLGQRFTELAQRHGAELESLARLAAETEDRWRAAERSTATAFTNERIARSEIVRQLHSNRGALRALYPRSARRVTSYYAPDNRRETEEAEEAEGVTEGTAAE